MNNMASACLRINNVALETVAPSQRNARNHSPKQIKMLADAITLFGFNNPILLDSQDTIIAGHARYEAAKLLKFKEIPSIRLEHLTQEQARAFRLADNRLAEKSEWDKDLLRAELMDLVFLDLDFDVTVTGFETAEIDQLILSDQTDTIDVPVPEVKRNCPSISNPGDLWILGSHKILCGNSLQLESFKALLGSEKADLVFTDPPYNVPVKGHILTKSAAHEEFVMARGEMSSSEFQEFLKTSLCLLEENSHEGSIHYICMDWRHIYDLLSVGNSIYSQLKNICIWNKTNGGMGSLYRSKHEMITVFKKGSSAHVNNIELGKHGRYRTNVWDYTGQSSLHSDRREELDMHPTVKPVQMVIDAILDCSHRNGIILDAFGGSGTLLLAAEVSGRSARVIEIDPYYVDVSIVRWQNQTGDKAVLASSGITFDELARRH